MKFLSLPRFLSLAPTVPMASSTPRVDLVVVFQATAKTHSKQEAREDAQAAEAEYSRLLNHLRESGLRATGRRGERTGQLLVLIYCPWAKLGALVKRER
jgi:anoctamin-10